MSSRGWQKRKSPDGKTGEEEELGRRNERRWGPGLTKHGIKRWHLLSMEQELKALFNMTNATHPVTQNSGRWYWSAKGGESQISPPLFISEHCPTVMDLGRRKQKYLLEGTTDIFRNWICVICIFSRAQRLAKNHKHILGKHLTHLK